MYKLLFVFCLFLLVSLVGKADTIAPKKVASAMHKVQVLQKDSSRLAIRNFNNKALEQYKKDSDFNYYRDEDLHSLSLWDRFWRWFWRLIRRLFGSEGGNESSGAISPAVRYVLLALIIAGVIYAVIKLLGAWNVFGKESQQIEIPYTESLENIHEITFDEELEKAIAQRNYRLGVRLLYLRSLKQLNDAQLIHWQTDKTNATYLNELTDSGQRQSFGVLTRQFEYIWYGDFPIDSNSYQNISILFQDFKKILP
jgi:hypothetical protein